jgi:hypothetical protein
MLVTLQVGIFGIVLGDDFVDELGLLLISLRDNISAARIDYIMGPTALQRGVLQFIVDVPPVGFEDHSNAVAAQVPVGNLGIETSDV